MADMSAELLLQILGLGIGGINELGQATGLWKGPEQRAQEKADEKAEKIRTAQRLYLEKNMPTLDYQKKSYDPRDYADVLDPMREELGGQMQAMSNSAGLRGTSRGGVSQSMQLDALRKGNQDIGRAGMGLARQGDEQAWQRAMALYNAKLKNAETMAQYQG